MRTFKRTYYHAGELVYVSEIVIMYICARVIASVRFDVMRASVIKIAYVKPCRSG
jgi:hypothetical protein